MFIMQSELFRGLGHDFVKKVMEKTEKVSMEKGDVLFREGKPAEYFYTLLKGRVRINVGEIGQSVTLITHAGESFGWSSLVGREAYSGTAECIEPTSAVKIHREDLQTICREYPEDGLFLMKHLAALLGQRLIQSYHMLRASTAANESNLIGTGQLQEMAVEK